MELLDIVDEYGNYTGEVMEREKVHELNLLHWEIAIFIINKNKQLLLQKRSSNKKNNPNMWGLCAGHVISKEDIDMSALREAKEELGLKLSLNDLKVLEKMEVQKRKTNSHLTRFYYYICNKNNFDIEKEELTEVKWFDIDKVIDMINNDDNSLVLKKDRLYLLNRLKELILQRGE